MARFASLTADAAITDGILASPGWARVGLTVRDQALRRRAAEEIARTVIESFMDPPSADDLDQPTLL